MSDWLSALFGPGLKFGKWITYEMRVVRIVRKRSRNHGLELNARALRTHLYATHFLERIRDDVARQALRDSLDTFTEDSAVSSDLLFSWIEQAATDRADAVVASNTNAASVRERVDSVRDAVVASDRDRTLWETRLAGMRPSRALAARAAQQVWPRLDTVLGLLDGPNRGARLDGWARNEPQFLSDAPAQVWCWLADLAEDAGAASSAAVFLDKALTLGAHPLGYWEIRREWVRRSAQGGHSVQSQQTAQQPRDTGHALVRAWQLELEGNIDQARDVLTAWDPGTAEETATRSLLMARIAASQNDHAGAIRLALSLFEETGSPAAVIIAARSLVAQQLFESTALHASNTADAFALLIKARDLFRRWQVDSVDVIVLAATMARLLNDPLRALSLTTAEPNGEATPTEASSLKVRASAALLHADNGDLEQGRALVDEPDLAPATASHLRALIALADEDEEAAARHFESALDLTDDFQEKGTFALALARLGKFHPFAEKQRAAGNSTFAEHLRLIADAVSGVSGGMGRLQAAAHTSANLSLVLSEIYETHGETEKQALMLEAAAARMNDSDIWLAAARVRWQRGEADKALRDAEEARANAPHQWGAYPRTYALLVELYSASGIWGKALDAAENLVRVSSNDPLAVWSLISCQYYAGEFEAALRTWDTLTDRQRPVRRQLILVWLGLYEQYGELVAGTADLVDIANEWAEDEYIRGRIVGLLLLPRRAPAAELTDEPQHDQQDDGRQEQEPDGDGGEQDPEQLARAALFGDYFRDFPDGAIKRIGVSDEDDDDDAAAGAKLLAQIIDAVGERPDTSDFDAQIFTAVLPVGTATYAHGGTVAEAVVTHASGVRFSSRGDESERSIARLALANSVVADTTSLFFLATLPEELRLGLTGVFASLGVSADQFRDAVTGLSQAERFGYATSITGGMRGPVALRARFRDEAGLDVSRLSALVELMRPLVRHERPRTTTRDRAEQLRDDTWYAAANVAGDVRPLWSDDRTLNIVAADYGVQTFSTPALLDVLEEEGRLSPDTVRQVRAHLVAERYVHVDFDEDIFARAMTLRPGAAMNVASVVEHLDGARAEAKCDFMLSHAAQHTPDGVRLERWISATVRWMIRISPDENAMASNLALLARKVLKAPWVVPQTFAYVDAGFTDARQSPAGPGCSGSPGHTLTLASDEDPLAHEIERRFRFVARTDRMLATRWLLALMAGLDASERPRYTAIILRP